MYPPWRKACFRIKSKIKVKSILLYSYKSRFQKRPNKKKGKYLEDYDLTPIVATTSSGINFRKLAISQ
jgi:hypothetical protein